MKSAIISPCGLYRYELRRWWVERPMSWVLWIMLNPSTADAEIDDPTVTRCINFSKAWEYDGLIIVNTYAFRTPDPTELQTAWCTGVDVRGPENIQRVREAARLADLAVAGWGTNKLGVMAGGYIGAVVEQEGLPLHYLRLTKDGHPGHPLYLPEELTPQPWSRAA